MTSSDAEASDGPVLRGERLVLRPTVAGDRDELVAIRRTPEVFARWRGEDLEAEFDSDLHDQDAHRFTIVDDDGITIGLIQFFEEDDPEYRHASIDIYLSPAAHGRGLGPEALRTLIRHLFDDRGHHRITIDPAAANTQAIAAYEKVGFRPVGILRQYERQLDGTWADGLLLDLVRSDWDSDVRD